MDIEILNNRIDDIKKALEQSLAQHNMLLGRLEEAKYFLEQAEVQELINEGEPV